MAKSRSDAGSLGTGNGRVSRSKANSSATAPTPEAIEPSDIHHLAADLLNDPLAWFATPNSQLGERTPGSLLGTAEQDKVYHLLAAVDRGLF